MTHILAYLIIQEDIFSLLPAVLGVLPLMFMTFLINLGISGSIIRAMRRLEEILRQLIQASKSIGNTDLENKFSESVKIV